MQLEIKESHPYLTGWYFVEWSNQLKKGGVKPLKIFGQDVVLSRTQSGKVLLFDAFCPHLGAHLGHGGKIKGENLVCPFHLWEFDDQGDCAKIPYSCRLNTKAKLRKWKVQEANGIIFTYYHPEGKEPSFDLPHWDIFEGKKGWTQQKRKKIINKALLQDIVENAVDISHFAPVHFFDDPKMRSLEFQDHTFKMIMDSKKKVLGMTFDSDLEIFYQGPGFALAGVNHPVQFKLITAVTPIDEKHVMHTFSFVFKKGINPLTDFFLHSYCVKKAFEDYSHDIKIWANKAYLTKPRLVDGEGPIMKVRHWFRQFENGEPV